MKAAFCGLLVPLPGFLKDATVKFLPGPIAASSLTAVKPVAGALPP